MRILKTLFQLTLFSLAFAACNTEEVKIDAIFGGEYSATRQIFHYDHGKIVHLIYTEEFPKWDDYNKRHPSNTEIDKSKLTYTNDRVEIDFYPIKKIRTYSNKKRIKNVISEERIQQLLDCAKQMEKELSSEKQLVKVE